MAKKAFSDLFLTEKRGRAIESSVSLVSQVVHLVSFELKKPRAQFDKAMLIFSVDVDAGNKELGLANGGKNDSNVHKCFSEAYIGDIEERALPVFLGAFNEFEVPATFALRGQITEFAQVAQEIVDKLLDSPVKHDIGAHGYTHRNFQALSREEAQEELEKIAVGLRKFTVSPKSFVFPRNMVQHLDLLEKFNYRCYRESAGSPLGDGMYIEKRGNLYNVHPSLYLNLSVTPMILDWILDVAVAKKVPLHLWFHPWTFGDSDDKIKKYVAKVFSPFLKYAQGKVRNGSLTVETMLSAAQKANAKWGDAL
ncbi:MAG: polysaccharide deacetylase family protein [Candidatus Bathyarchaeota archaeon]|nr:polysaccharide deacetylase family protein [Candidatus Bathyarchaeota archaeon]